MAKLEKARGQIQRLLLKDSRGLTIQEIADLLKISRITARMALIHMEGAGKLDVRTVGNCRMHYLKKH